MHPVREAWIRTIRGGPPAPARPIPAGPRPPSARHHLSAPWHPPPQVLTLISLLFRRWHPPSPSDGLSSASMRPSLVSGLVRFREHLHMEQTARQEVAAMASAHPAG